MPLDPLWYTSLYPQAGPMAQASRQQAGVFVTPNQQQSQRQGSLAPIPQSNPYLASLARNMMATGSSTEPVSSPLAGLARSLTGAAGGFFAGQANEAQQARQGAIGERIGALTGLDAEQVQGLSPEQALQVAQVRATQQPKAVETWRPLSPSEAESQGLPEGVFQISSKGKIQPVSKGGVEVNVDTGQEYDEKAAQERAKSDVSYRAELRAGANTARKKAVGLNRLENLFKSGKLETGALQPVKRWAAQFANAVGLDPEAYGLGDVATAEEGRALMNRMVMDSLDAFAGALSEKELAFAEAASTGESLTPEANLALIGLAKTAADRQVQQYSMLRKWNRDYGSPGAVNDKGQDFEDMWDAWLQEQGEGFEPPAEGPAGSVAVQAGVVPSGITAVEVREMPKEDLRNLDMDSLSGEALDAVIERLNGG